MWNQLLILLGIRADPSVTVDAVRRGHTASIIRSSLGIGAVAGVLVALMAGRGEGLAFGVVIAVALASGALLRRRRLEREDEPTRRRR